MKAKSIILSLALVTIAVVSTNAQGFQLGIKGGANIYQVDGRSFDDTYKWGYSLGGFAEINFSKHFGIQPEVLWNEYQTRTAANNIGGVGYEDLSNGTDIKLNYLTIPVLLAFKPAKILTIHVGPQFGILINESQTFIDNSKNAFKRGDLSLLAGAQLNLAWFKLGARYFIGLNNLDDVGNSDTWKNQGFQIYAGVRIL
jgi:hypothetical protein